MLNDLGLNINYIAQMKMAISPQIGNLTRIADYLDVPLDYLLYGAVDRPTPISAREEELIRIVSQMTDEQRESLLVLLRAMQDGKN
jgi:transcriptional regulator with XRE-family HTH domain